MQVSSKEFEEKKSQMIYKKQISSKITEKMQISPKDHKKLTNYIKQWQKNMNFGNGCLKKQISKNCRKN